MNYASISGKLRLIGLGNLHDLLNKVIDLNSPAMVAQQIRDLTTERDKVDKGLSDAIVDIRLNNRKKRDMAARLDTVNLTLEHIKSNAAQDQATKMKAGAPFMKEKLDLEKDLGLVNDVLATTAATQATLQEALVAIDSQIHDMEARLARLQSTTHAAEAKEAATDALKTAREILTSSNTSGVDNALSRAEQRNETAGVGLEREMEHLKDATGAASKNTEVDAALAAFMSDSPKPQTASAA